MKPVRIIGVGSPAGDDQAGWWTIEAFDRDVSRSPAMMARICTMALDRPGINLVNLMQGAQRVFLIDAVQSRSPPGTIYRLSIAELAAWEETVSSHGFGVAMALHLARELNALPKALSLYGIGIESAAAGGKPCLTVRNAAHAVAHEILGVVSSQ